MLDLPNLNTLDAEPDDFQLVNFLGSFLVCATFMLISEIWIWLFIIHDLIYVLGKLTFRIWWFSKMYF